MGRKKGKKSKGKNKNKGPKRALKNEEEEEEDNFAQNYSDSEQARALPPTNIENTSENGLIFGEFNCEGSAGNPSLNLSDPIFPPDCFLYDIVANQEKLEKEDHATYFYMCQIMSRFGFLRIGDQPAATTNRSIESEDSSHEKQLLDMQKGLRFVQIRPPSQDSGNEFLDKRAAARLNDMTVCGMLISLAITRAIRLNLNSAAIQEYGIRMRNHFSPYFPSLSTIDFDCEDLPGSRIETHEVFHKTSNEAGKKVPKEVTHSYAVSAVERAITFGAEAGRIREVLKSTQKTKNPPQISSNSSKGTTKRPRDKAESNNVEMDTARSYYNEVSLGENLPLELRIIHQITSEPQDETSNRDLGSTVGRLENLKINDISPSEARLGHQVSPSSLEDFSNNIKLNKRKISEQSSTPTRNDLSVRKKDKTNNSSVNRTRKNSLIDDCKSSSTPSRQSRSVRNEVKTLNSNVNRAQENSSIDHCESTIHDKSSSQSRQDLSVPRIIQINNSNVEETQERNYR